MGDLDLIESLEAQSAEIQKEMDALLSEMEKASKSPHDFDDRFVALARQHRDIGLKLINAMQTAKTVGHS